MTEADRSKWDRIYQRREGGTGPAPAIVELRSLFPRVGRALDVAGGMGRHALWLAQCGFDVTLCDISSVALNKAQRSSDRLGLSLKCHLLDLEQEPLPVGPWELILVSHYLDRILYSQLPGLLAAGGILMIVHPTVRNLERHAKPSRRFLLEAGELSRLVSPLKLLYQWEGWSEGEHLAIIVRHS